MSGDYKPRLIIDVRQDQLDDLRNLLDWGIRSRVFEPILDDLIGLLKKDRAAVTAFLIAREIKLADFLQKGGANGND